MIYLNCDEAHGPHYIYHDELPVSAVDAGADICTQSTHKILGSMTQNVCYTCKILIELMLKK